MIIHMTVYARRLVLVGLYLPPPARVQLLYDIMQIVMGYCTQEIFLFGDFNLVPSQEMYRLSSGARISSDLLNWATTFALTDAWTHFHPRDREYTCHSASYRTLSQIDLVYVSTGALCWMREVKHLPRGISDHAPLSLAVSLDRSSGPRLWRLCLSRFWAMDDRIQEAMSEAICNFWLRNRESANALILWDTFMG